MSEQKAAISQNQIEEQKAIMQRIRQNNDMLHSKTGINKKMYIVTYGCQQNVSDSEKLKGMFIDMGYQETVKKEEADVILYNTCCVRENAELKVYGHLGALKKLKEQKPELIIAVCGCMMQQAHVVEHINKKYRHVDLIFGTHNLYKFPQLLEQALNEKNTLVEILDIEGQIHEGIPVLRENTSRAWVTIMYGCNNFCSYCIVPYVRGRERSRKPEFIIEEIRELAQTGCKEVTLLGQNVNSYGKDLEHKIDFADLIRMVNEVEGIERIRFMTSHPKDISDKLIQTIAECKNVCKHLHLPFQAGSNKILKAMNRKYTREEYIEKIEKVKALMPDIALSTDIIVGFPGETDEDFEQTLDIVRMVGFDQIYMFIYSKRKGTPAEKMEDVIDEVAKKANFQRLIDTQNEISKGINEKYVGKVVEVLVEGPSKTDSKVLMGRTEGSKVVNFKGGKELIDKIVKVKITEAHSWFLNGELM